MASAIHPNEAPKETDELRDREKEAKRPQSRLYVPTAPSRPASADVIFTDFAAI